MAQPLDHTASSTGRTGTAGDWLDLHFEAARPEYEAQLRAVGIQPGWRVLDAACGSGSFLPWLADLVGPGGHLSALDLAAENVALAERRLAGWDLPCAVEIRVGSAVELPFPDDAFDALWFPNTTVYLTDEELRGTLAEFRRVVRPGGLVAVKEIDVSMFRVCGAPPGLVFRHFQARATDNVHAAAAVRAPDLPGWLRRAGLRAVWQRTTLIERAAPLDAVSRAFWTSILPGWAARASERDLPPADQAFWAGLRDPAAFERYLDNPDCWLAEANVLAVGTVPD